MEARQNALNLGANNLEFMKLQFLGFPKDKPTQVVMDYDDYVEIARKLNLPLAENPVAEGISGMEWYSLMESSHSILNSLAGLAFREIWNESKKGKPDQAKIAELESLRMEVAEVKRNPKLFQNMLSMQAIVDKYSPILIAEKKKLNQKPAAPPPI